MLLLEAVVVTGRVLFCYEQQPRSQDNRLGEIVRMQLQYDEAFKQVSHLQQQLADVEDQMDPAQAVSDKDRCVTVFGDAYTVNASLVFTSRCLLKIFCKFLSV